MYDVKLREFSKGLRVVSKRFKEVIKRSREDTSEKVKSEVRLYHVS